METLVPASTSVGFGYANLADAFQRGREAAQMAKSQGPDAPPSLVLAFGPANVHFQDFIEGVRLVTGEDVLIGIPAEGVMLSGLQSAGASLVMIVHSSTLRFTVAAADVPADNLLKAATLAIDGIRSTRAGTRRHYSHSGLLLFHTFHNEHLRFVQEMSGSTDLEAWILSVSLQGRGGTLVCQNRVIHHGVVAIECLSNEPWGLGNVGIGPFLNQPDIYSTSVRSAVRDAATQIDASPSPFGLLFTDFSLDHFSSSDLSEVFTGSNRLVKSLGLVSLPHHSQVVRSGGHSSLTPKNSVVALLASHE